MTLTANQIDAYERDGYFVQLDALSQEEVENLLACTLEFQTQSYPGHVLEKTANISRLSWLPSLR